MKVPGVGPVPCDFMVVAEGPGKVEARTLTPLSGPTGKDFDRYARRHYIVRENTYITNVYKFFTGTNPTPEQVESGRPELEAEIASVSPRYIAALGEIAASWFLGKVDMRVVNGIPYQWNGSIVTPIIHPAAGLHHPATMSKIDYGFGALEKVLRGDLTPSLEAKQSVATILLSNRDADKIYRKVVRASEMAMDTEDDHDKLSWGLSFSVHPYIGYVILRVSNLALEALNQGIQDNKHLQIIMQNALYDLNPLEGLGIHIPTDRLHDTMLDAFHLCVEPKGLKDLAKRHLKVDMKSYMDVVGPTNDWMALGYLEQVVGREWPKPEPQWVRVVGSAEMRQKKPHSINQRANRIMKDYGKDPTTEIRRRWKDVEDVIKQDVLADVGDMPVAFLSDVKLKDAVAYSGADAARTLGVRRKLAPLVKEQGLEEISAIDHAVIPMLDRMRRAGLRVDKTKLQHLGAAFDKDLKRLEDQAEQLTGYRINLSSGQQKSDLLYKKLHLPIIKRTKKERRGATDKATLEALKDFHPVVSLLIEESETGKLRNTYTNKLPLWMGEDDRIHPQIGQTRIPSGRLNVSEPNLLAIPKRTELGIKIRECFLPAEGCEFGACDLVQIELKFLAHMSGDHLMRSAFVKGEDLHWMTACKMFGKPQEQLDKIKHRYPAKSLNFGIAYGITAKGLKVQMALVGITWSEEECEDFIQEWFKLFPQVKKWIENTKAFALRNGYTADLYGRRRYVTEIYSQKEQVREQGFRQGVNHVIQSSAQGFLKKGMALLQPVIAEAAKDIGVCRELLQIHDELLFEMSRGEKNRKWMDRFMKVIESGDKLSVPVVAESQFGGNWGELK